MRQISRRMLPALLAVLCMSAVVTAGASATTKKGELVNEKGTALVKNKITGSGRSAELEWNGAKWECKTTALAETMTSTKAGTGTLTLAGCDFEPVCKTAGAKNYNEWVLPLTIGVTTEKERDLLLNQVPETALKCNVGPSAIRGSFPIRGLVEGSLFTETEFDLKYSTTPTLEMSINGGAFKKLEISASVRALFEEKAKFV